MTITPSARRWLIYSLLCATLSSLIMGVLAIEYANYSVRKSQQQWCEVVGTLDGAYKENPPQTPTGKHLAEEFARLNDQFNCGSN